MGEENKKIGPPVKGRLRLAEVLRPHWVAMSLAAVAVIGETAADLAQPWPLKIVLDYVLPKNPKHMPGWLAAIVHRVAGTNNLAILNVAIGAVVVIAIVGGASSYAEKYLTTSVGQWVTHDMRRTLYHHIHRLSLSQHDEARTGDLISRVTSDIEAIQDFITQALLGIAVDVLTIAGMVGVMFYLNWQFTLVALSVVPPLFVVVYFYTRRIKKAARDVRKKESELLSVVQEVLSSIRVVQAFAREDYEQKRFEGTSLANVETALRARVMKAKLAPIVDVIVAVGTCLVLGLGARLVLADRMEVGTLVVFVLYLASMYKPMRDLSKMTDTISKAFVGYERINEVLETESRVKDLPRARPAPAFKGLIEFEHVKFGYSEDVCVLEDVSFRIDPGKVVAFVGPTGAGKSTIIGLIARFYDPQSGIVKIDGRDIRSFTLKSLRRQMSFVLQDTLLFRAPLWQNIAYGKPEAKRDEIVRAAQLANASEFIDKLPDGYDTMVGERGVTLSGGQRQRIAIARAILRGAPILILDEPTSSLDASSEQLVIEALERLMQGKTSIVIAHHLSTIQKADEIFVVKDCALVEHGVHADLLSKGGVYADLYNLQRSPAESEPEPTPAG
ncbi:MAG TPA: ABC transporter ATP-binding protein [Candidatus Acidoferrales bacterium]|nr:ABC transporter ATP-binding protein [Candidatus Acidoferrales bacterium]